MYMYYYMMYIRYLYSSLRHVNFNESLKRITPALMYIVIIADGFVSVKEKIT